MKLRSKEKKKKSSWAAAGVRRAGDHDSWGRASRTAGLVHSSAHCSEQELSAQASEVRTGGGAAGELQFSGCWESEERANLYKGEKRERHWKRGVGTEQNDQQPNEIKNEGGGWYALICV